MTTISFNEFMSYKSQNKEILSELVEFINKKHSVKNNTLQTKNNNKNTDDKLYSQYTSILNKLSDSNFNVLAKELITLRIEKDEHIIKLAEFVFNKAIIEPKFSGMYAKLARELINYSININGTTYYFIKLLIERCQMAFKQCITNNKENTEMTEPMKRKEMGCMFFIGELYLYRLISDKVICGCINQLLDLVNSTELVGRERPSIGLVFGLIKIVGEQLINKCYDEGNLIFDKIDTIIKTGGLINKDKFALMDLVDLRKKWIKV